MLRQRSKTCAGEAELNALLKGTRPKLVNRASTAAAVAKDAETLRQVLDEAGQMVLPVHASTIFTADKSLLTGVLSNPQWITGPINSGWVFPTIPH